MASNSTSPIIPAVLVSWVQLLVPEKCFDEFFVEFNLLHVPCLKVVVSKALGYAIILGALVVKLPQVIKIWNAKSGEGISLSAVVLEMVAICSSAIYSFRNGFPFSSYGEGLFMAIQTMLIGIMVLHFSNKPLFALLFLLSFSVGSGFLMSPVVPAKQLAILQTGNIFLVIASKLMQAVVNFRQGNTGQLSVITVFLLMLGSTARIFTSIQETGDQLIIASFCVATFFNVVIALQMVYYWNVPLKESTYMFGVGEGLADTLLLFTGERPASLPAQRSFSGSDLASLAHRTGSGGAGGERKRLVASRSDHTQHRGLSSREC